MRANPEPVPGVPRRRAAVRLAFAAAAALWLVQVPLLGGGAGEPYPGILMPSFAGTGGYGEGRVQIERMQPVFTGPAGEWPVPQRELLAEFPDSHHNTLAALLNPSIRAARPLELRLRAWGLDGLARGRTDRRPECTPASLRAWARRRARALLPGERPERLELRWYRDTFTRGARTRREPAGTWVVALGEEGTCAG
jgi:hypothetical protein